LRPDILFTRARPGHYHFDTDLISGSISRVERYGTGDGWVVEVTDRYGHVVQVGPVWDTLTEAKHNVRKRWLP
jgi:hypothetical protein